MASTRYDFQVQQGADIDFTVTIYADDAHTVIQPITGWDAKLEIRDKAGGALLEQCTVGNGKLTINGPAGQVTVHVAGSVTAAYTWTAGIYDLFVLGPANAPTKRPLFGYVTVSPRITQ